VRTFWGIIVGIRWLRGPTGLPIAADSSPSSVRRQTRRSDRVRRSAGGLGAIAVPKIAGPAWGCGSSPFLPGGYLFILIQEDWIIDGQCSKRFGGSWQAAGLLQKFWMNRGPLKKIRRTPDFAPTAEMAPISRRLMSSRLMRGCPSCFCGRRSDPGDTEAGFGGGSLVDSALRLARPAGADEAFATLADGRWQDKGQIRRGGWAGMVSAANGFQGRANPRTGRRRC